MYSYRTKLAQILLPCLCVALLFTACFTAGEAPPVDNPSDREEAIPVHLEAYDAQLEGLSLYQSAAFSLAVDSDEMWALETYIDAEIGEDGIPQYDDGQNWAVVVRRVDGCFVVFPKSYVQLGGVTTRIYRDYNDDTLHLYMTMEQSAAMRVWDFVYDRERDCFLRTTTAELDNISWIG